LTGIVLDWTKLRGIDGKKKNNNGESVADNIDDVLLNASPSSTFRRGVGINIKRKKEKELASVSLKYLGL
jgi:hypothetical protein